ncbi:MAG: hypothetical protein IPL95_09240 [Saprospiraceae bacterium]|nr:hypothetical protein [Saprospiraceae bacterium]
MTMQEGAQQFGNGYSKEKLSVGAFPIGILKFMSIFMPYIKFQSNLMQIMLNNIDTFESQKTWDLLGKPMISVEQFAKKQ